MKTFRKHLEKIIKLRRRDYHPSLHKVHKKYNISKKTLFYVKEYGPHTNVAKTIVRESVKILLLASLISSFGGFALEHIKTVLISVIPLVVLLPALNDMIGDYGTIVSSRFSTMLHEGEIKGRWWLNKEVRKLFIQIFIVSIFTALLSSAAALFVSGFSNPISFQLAAKIFLIAIIDVTFLVSIVFLTSILGGLHFYKNKEDPNNLLIPIATSVADFGNMIILSALIILLL